MQDDFLTMVFLEYHRSLVFVPSWLRTATTAASFTETEFGMGDGQGSHVWE